jgi:mannose-6-phosphate isomerase-like protein (cupin superfamily)
MQLLETTMEQGFDVVATTERAQAATMVLEAGEQFGGPENRNEDAEQWLIVMEGDGEAIIEGERFELQPGTMLLIEPGERHEVRAGMQPLRTLNFYTPPEY